ncbi:MAG: DUF2854 domain-containing protein [Cyanobacteria bacterium J06649_11]|nr:DUF2854 domain-containing protein [Rivularia sp. ALOHA_DT_140]
MLRKISLGTVGLIIGGILTVIGFVSYAVHNATLNLIGFFYGIPVLLGGLALKANELKPIPFVPPTPESVLSLREAIATETQNQVRQDITRYRYGIDVHLDKALTHLGLGQLDEELPEVLALREAEIDGNYALILDFDSPQVPFDVWQEKQQKMTSFFGPGVDVKITQPEDEKIELALITSSEAEKS